jgi:hypothetical protein
VERAIHGSVARASSALFAGTQGRKRIGEASVWYLYSSVAPREINQFSPEADIIVMLRNPFEALPSLHSQFVFVGIEPVEAFEEALALDEERERAGTRLTSRRALTGRPLAIPSRSSGIWPSLDRNESTSYMRTSDATHWRPTVPQGRVAASRLNTSFERRPPAPPAVTESLQPLVAERVRESTTSPGST